MVHMLRLYLGHKAAVGHGDSVPDTAEAAGRGQQLLQGAEAHCDEVPGEKGSSVKRVIRTTLPGPFLLLVPNLSIAAQFLDKQPGRSVVFGDYSNLEQTQVL